MMDTKITQALESLEPTLVELLNRWIAVPSVKAEGIGFGKGIALALDGGRMEHHRAVHLPEIFQDFNERKDVRVFLSADILASVSLSLSK